MYDPLSALFKQFSSINWVELNDDDVYFDLGSTFLPHEEGMSVLWKRNYAVAYLRSLGLKKIATYRYCSLDDIGGARGHVGSRTPDGLYFGQCYTKDKTCITHIVQKVLFFLILGGIHRLSAADMMLQTNRAKEIINQLRDSFNQANDCTYGAS